MGDKPEDNETRVTVDTLGLLKLFRLVAIIAFAVVIAIFLTMDSDVAANTNWEAVLPATITFFILVIVLLQFAIQLRKGPGSGLMGKIVNNKPEETLDSVEEIQNIDSDLYEYVPEEYLSGSEVEERVVQALEKPTDRAVCPNCEKIVDIKDGTCLECGEPVVKEN